jgi:hypothetical protein
VDDSSGSLKHLTLVQPMIYFRNISMLKDEIMTMTAMIILNIVVLPWICMVHTFLRVLISCSLLNFDQ